MSSSQPPSAPADNEPLQFSTELGIRTLQQLLDSQAELATQLDHNIKTIRGGAQNLAVAVTDEEKLAIIEKMDDAAKEVQELGKKLSLIVGEIRTRPECPRQPVQQ